MEKGKDIFKQIINEGLRGNEALQESGITKDSLMTELDKGDASAAVLLLLGIRSHKTKYWIEDFEDEDTGDIIPITRSCPLDSFIFESEETEEQRIEEILSSKVKDQTDETLRSWYNVFYRNIIPLPISIELSSRNDLDALEWMGDYYSGRFGDNSFPSDKKKGQSYFKRALDAGLSKDKYEYDIKCLEYGVSWDGSLDWVFNDAFYYVHSLMKDYPDENWTFVQCCEQVIDNVWYSFFPSPTAKSMMDSPVIKCTLKEVVDRLVSQGISESAFRKNKQGVIVDLKNLSFCLAVGQEDYCSDPDALVVGPYYRIIDPDQSHYYFMEEDSFSAEEFVDYMYKLDRQYPEIISAISLIYDKLMIEKEEREKITPIVKETLKDIYGSDYSNIIKSADFYYSFGPNYRNDGIHYKDYKFYEEKVSIQYLKRDFYYLNSDLDLCYEDFLNLPKDFFLWYSDNPLIHDFEIQNDDDNGLGDETRIIRYYGDSGFVEFKARLSDLTYEFLSQRR